MATLASEVRPMRKKLRRRNGVLRLVDEQGTQIPQSILIGASERFHARQLQARLERTIKRHKDAPERQSIAIAMLAVEERLVKAFWVLGRSTANPGPQESRRHGIGYLFERADQDARYQDAAAQNWQSVSPRPPVPSGREIDAADRALEWLQIIGRDQAEVVSAGARSKQGDIARRVNWMRVRLQMPKYSGWTCDRLRKVYQEGLRIMAAEVSA